MQKVECDWNVVIEIENKYLEAIANEEVTKIFNERCYSAMQYLDFTIIDEKEMKQFVADYDNLVRSFIQEWQAMNEKWEGVFCEDNLVVFDNSSWKLFLKTKPVINWGEGWTKINNKKKFRGFNHNRTFKLKINGWLHLKKNASRISLVININDERNNMIYLNLMKTFCLAGKVRKFENFLEKARKRKFIKMEADHQ
jgi:hypothetical protein